MITADQVVGVNFGIGAVAATGGRGWTGGEDQEYAPTGGSGSFSGVGTSDAGSAGAGASTTGGGVGGVGGAGGVGGGSGGATGSDDLNQSRNAGRSSAASRSAGGGRSGDTAESVRDDETPCGAAGGKDTGEGASEDVGSRPRGLTGSGRGKGGNNDSGG